MTSKKLLFCAASILAALVCNAELLKLHTFPEEFLTKRYEASVDGQQAQIFHAGNDSYLISFDFKNEVEIKVKVCGRAWVRYKFDNKKFWDGGAYVSPKSQNIKCERDGLYITFKIKKPGQYVLRRSVEEGLFTDFAFFVFANPPETDIPNRDSPNVLYFGAGTHWQNIDLKTGQTLYLDSGAVLFGAINVFNADNVRICGRGTAVYCGPQSKEYDLGYILKKDWHPLCVDRSKNLDVSGVTFVNRSRTWTVQTRKLFGAVFDNIKILVASQENVNGDGFDFFGGGDIVIKNSLIRSADDCVAIFSEGSCNNMYPEANAELKDNFTNIAVENCVMWPTIANMLRVGFRNQNLTVENITFRDSDVVYIGGRFWLGPWSMICAMTDAGPVDSLYKNIIFENLRFESPTALMSVQNKKVRIGNLVYKNISMPAQVPSLMLGTADNAIYENIEIGGKKVSGPEFSDYKDRLK